MKSRKDITPISRLLGANLAWIATGFLMAAPPAVHAQNTRTGVSVAQPITSDASAATPETAAPAKPSAAIPIAPASTASPVVYGSYVPYRTPSTAAPADMTSAAASDSGARFDPDADIVMSETIHRHALTSSTVRGEGSTDADANIVTHVPTRPGEINDGTVIRAQLRETLSTTATQPGSRFSAEISEPVMQDGRVYIPAGAVLEGRVTWVSGGKRIGGRAAIHLEPQRVMLPDGTEYRIHARVIDTSSWENTAVDREGTIIRKDNLKGTLEAGGLATGGAIAAGALVAGPAGALVGAGVGAGATAIVWFKQDRQATLPKDLGVTFSLTAPLSVEAAHAARPTPLPAGE